MKQWKYNWVVQCFGCHANYFDHRRRVGKCLHCKSPAVIVSREGASCFIERKHAPQ